MRYQGGKSRISKSLERIITNDVFRRQIPNFSANCTENRGTTLVSLFCGTCSVESKLAPYFDKGICNDSHKYLIAMLQAVQNGFELPEKVTEQEYKFVREHKDNKTALTGFVGFGCSFGGKWFGGYARNKSGTNCALQSKRSLLKDMETLRNATFICSDYKAVEIPENAIVYADPPYSNTTGYGSKKFNSDEFWEYMREISKTHDVYISEQTAPEDFECIWEKLFTRTLDRNKSNQFVVTEKLFKLKKGGAR